MQISWLFIKVYPHQSFPLYGNIEQQISQAYKMIAMGHASLEHVTTPPTLLQFPVEIFPHSHLVALLLSLEPYFSVNFFFYYTTLIMTDRKHTVICNDLLCCKAD